MVFKSFLRLGAVAAIVALAGTGCLPQAATPTPLPVVIPGETPPMVMKLDLEVLAPTHLESDGESVWVSSVGTPGQLNTTVQRFGLDGTELVSFDIGSTPGPILFDGENIWVAELGTPNEPGSSVFKLSGEGVELGAYEAGIVPFAMTFDGRIFMGGEPYRGHRDEDIYFWAEIGKLWVGDGPSAVGFDGVHVWVTNMGSPESEGNTVQKLDGDGRIVAEYEVGLRPIAMAFDGNSMWIANSGPLEDDQADSVTRLGLDGRRLGEFRVGNGPVDILYDGESIWVANAGSNNVMRLSTSGLTLGVFDVESGPVSLALDGKDVWVASLEGNTLSKIVLSGGG